MGRILIPVEIKLIAPRIDDAPAKWSEKMVRSMEIPGCPMLAARGGYTVHPVPAPASVKALIISKMSEGGRSQNLRLFIRGNAISGVLIIKGSSQLPNPPIMIGITMKKIIMKA